MRKPGTQGRSADAPMKAPEAERNPAPCRDSWGVAGVGVFAFYLAAVTFLRLPPQLLHRRKMGFGVPLEHWSRGPLRDFLRDTLLSSRCLDRGCLVPDAVRALVEEHVSGQRNWQSHRWDLVVLELWFRTFIEQAWPQPLASL